MADTERTRPPSAGSRPDRAGESLAGPSAIDANGLGERLRAARHEHGLTLRETAERSGLSRAFISQVERGKVSPSVASLSKIAEALSISLSELFLPPRGRTEGLVRATERVRMTFRRNEFWDDVLSPSLGGKLLVLQSTILPRADSGPAYHHDADEECVIVLEGRLEVRVDDVAYELGPGDALTFSSRRPHSWRNLDEEHVVAVWVITPPRY